MFNCSVGRSSVAHCGLQLSPLPTRDLVNCSISVLLRIGHLWLTVVSIALHSLLGTLLTVIPVCLTVLWVGHLWLTVVSIALQGLGSAATYLGSLLLMMKVKLSKYLFSGIVRLLLAVLRRFFFVFCLPGRWFVHRFVGTEHKLNTNWKYLRIKVFFRSKLSKCLFIRISKVRFESFFITGG